MTSPIPTGSMQTPSVQTQAMATKAHSNGPTMTTPTGPPTVTNPEERVIDQAINQIFR